MFSKKKRENEEEKLWSVACTVRWYIVKVKRKIDR